MRRLVLMRHATAAPPRGHGQGADFAHELTAAGVSEAQRMAAWLQRQGLRPDAALCSTAPRAAATARIVCDALGPAQGPAAERALYGADPGALLRRLGGLAGACVLVVGHNPAIEAVAVHLTGDEDLARRGLPPAGTVVVELPDDWADLGARTAQAWRVADPATV